MSRLHDIITGIRKKHSIIGGGFMRIHRGSTPHETENNSVVSRKQSPKHHRHSAQTSGNSYSPGKNEAAGDVRPLRNHKTFSAPAAPPNERIAPVILLPVRPPISAP